MNRRLRLLFCLLTILLLLPRGIAGAETADSPWVQFLLICNEGMQNDSGDVGNTVMIIGMNEQTGEVRQIMLLWDTFIDYPGFDLPQKIDQAFRVGGAEETLRIINENFGLNITSYLSINFLNLAMLIDHYGGVTMNVTREERNALNGMVASKESMLSGKVASTALDEMLLDGLFASGYLEAYGENVHLSGIQAVGFGWLQYDSVTNCCRRELNVVAQLFAQLGESAHKSMVLYDEESGVPEDVQDGRPVINLDALSEEDAGILVNLIRPVFECAKHNLSETMMRSLSLAMVRSVYGGEKNGASPLARIESMILPLEREEECVTIGGISGHVIDAAANGAAIRRFMEAGADEP